MMRVLFILTSLVISYSCFSQKLETHLKNLVKDSTLLKPFTASSSTDLKSGIIHLPPRFTNKRTGTIDSHRGEITNGALLITYDIGHMAGTHMHEELKEKCEFYLDSTINGYRTLIGLQKKNEQSELIITIFGSLDIRGVPANFWAVVQNEDDIENMLRIVFSYRPKMN